MKNLTYIILLLLIPACATTKPKPVICETEIVEVTKPLIVTEHATMPDEIKNFNMLELLPFFVDPEPENLALSSCLTEDQELQYKLFLVKIKQTIAAARASYHAGEDDTDPITEYDSPYPPTETTDND